MAFEAFGVVNALIRTWVCSQGCRGFTHEEKLIAFRTRIEKYGAFIETIPCQRQLEKLLKKSPFFFFFLAR